MVNLTVDGFIFKRPRTGSTVTKLKALVEGLTFSHLPKLEETVRCALEQPDPKQKRLRTTDLYPISGHQSNDQVFRVLVPEARQHLRGTTHLPVLNWHVSYARPGLCEVNADEAKAMVFHGQSLLVLGLAGVGKSHWTRERVAELEQAGKRVVTIAKTHNAALVVGGGTRDHFVWKHVREGGTGAHTVWIDELSMLDLPLLRDLNHLARRDPPIQFILSGDFNQYEPFFHTFMGEDVKKSFKASDLLALLSGAISCV